MVKKEHVGFKKLYSDELFLNALSETPQTTSAIKKKVGCVHDTASKTLKKLADEGYVEKMQIGAASGTGKMYLWSITDAGIKKRDEEQENTQ